MESSSQSGADSGHIPKPADRLAFVDWTRGLAAVIMLQGHVFHSLTRGDLRQGDHFILSQFVGGMPPAIFLFLTGMTLAFLMDGQQRRKVAAWDRIRAALGRAGYLALLAVLFRVQLFAFGWPYGDWASLFRVDILNAMALGIAAMALMSVFTTLERVRLSAILGLGIAVAAPIVSALDTSAIHPYLRNYFVPHLEFFGFFPWAAFLAFGMSMGSIVRLTPAAHLGQVMQWAGWVGLAAAFSAHYFSNLPFSLYAKSDFWLNSPALIFIKMGVVLIMMSFAYLWTTFAAPGWSWVRQLGTTSLLVYWVHTELVYGRWLGAWKENLTVGQTALMAVAVIALMLGISLAQTHWNRVREYLPLPRTRQTAAETE